MKKNYMIVSALVLAVGVLSFQRTGNESVEKYLEKHHTYPDGVGVGNASGAPGEGDCFNCHGSTQAGTSINSMIFLSGTTPVTSYTPGQSYTVNLSMSPNPTYKGFQSTAKVGTGSTAAGSFVALAGAAGAGVHIVGGRATHVSNSGSALWNWTWHAPATNVGTVTFYVSSMKTNGSGQGGDILYLSQHTIAAAASSAGIEEQTQNTNSFSAGYSADKNAVVMDFSSLVSGNMYFNLVDLSGKSVFTYKMGEAQIGDNHEVIALPEDLKNGIYLVNMFVGNKPMEQKIMIQK